MTMKKGEVALLTIAPEYAFGSSESKQDLAVIPPNSTVHYEVELVSFVKVCDVFFLFISNCKLFGNVSGYICISYSLIGVCRTRNHGI